MNKKTILTISIVVNILLALAGLFLVVGAIGELRFEYAEQESIRPDSLRMYLNRENYGAAASLSHPIRGGAEVNDEDLDYYMLGEYADVLFLKEVFAGAGDKDTYDKFENRASEIRGSMPDYAVIFDKIDISLENALRVK